jgi:hypothetical protein
MGVEYEASKEGSGIVGLLGLLGTLGGGVILHKTTY